MFVGLLIGVWQNGYRGCTVASIRRGLGTVTSKGRHRNSTSTVSLVSAWLIDRLLRLCHIAVPRYPHIQDAIDKGEVSLEARAISDVKKSFCCCALGCAFLWG